MHATTAAAAAAAAAVAATAAAAPAPPQLQHQAMTSVPVVQRRGAAFDERQQRQLLSWAQACF